MDEHQISWALSRVVPAMESCVTLETCYGSLELTGDDAQVLQAVVRRLLLDKRAQLKGGK